MMPFHTIFRGRTNTWLSNFLYWTLWFMVALLVAFAPNDQVSAAVEEQPTATSERPSDSIPGPVPKADKAAKGDVLKPDWNLQKNLKLDTPSSKRPEDPPPAVDIAKQYVDVPVSKRPGTYPDSNERGQIRLDADFKSSANLPIEIDPSGKGQPVAFRMMGPVEGLRIQAEGQASVGDLQGLVDSLIAGAKTDREKAERLFDFVINDMKDWYYPAQGIDLTVEDLKVLIWNFGFGFCYDLGRLQAGLWAHAGLRSRIVGWPQHTVAEVFYGDAWHLYDLQHRSFYEKPDGQVASFAELKANPKLFYQNLNEYGLDAIGYPPHHMGHWYGIANPKFEDSQDGDHWKTGKDFRMDLRKGELFDILYTQPGPAYHPDSWHQYYGETTLRKDPPWLLQGRLTYAPDFLNLPAKWEVVQTPNGTRGFALSFSNPFIFIEGWLKIPGVRGFPKYWVHAWDRTHFGGRLVGGNGIFSKHIAGSNSFTIVVEPDGEGTTAEDFGLERVQVHTRLQISPLGIPKLDSGKNHWPITFDSGTPHISLWYLERSPDLSIEHMTMVPEHPRPGTQAEVRVTVKNSGNANSQPTSLSLFNNVTAFHSETIEKVGGQMVPPLKPGDSATIQFPWIANTRMTWYGQNPFVQLFDAWLDIEGDLPDPVTQNNRKQFYILMAKEDGSLPGLPGYQSIQGSH